MILNFSKHVPWKKIPASFTRVNLRFKLLFLSYRSSKLDEVRVIKTGEKKGTQNYFLFVFLLLIKKTTCFLVTTFKWDHMHTKMYQTEQSYRPTSRTISIRCTVSMPNIEMIYTNEWLSN